MNFKKLNNGDYDDVIEQMILRGEPLNQITNALINLLLEQADVMHNAQFGIVLPGSEPVRIFDRDLDPAIDTYIAEHFAAQIETQTRPDGVKSDIMQELSTNLDNKNEPNYDKNVAAMIQKYGPLVILYELYSVHMPVPLKRSASVPTQKGVTELQTPLRAKTLPKSHKFRSGYNEYYIAYELKRQILNNYPQIPSIPFAYIPDFQGDMSDCVYQVLGCLYNEDKPRLGNIFTSIKRKQLDLLQQKEIFNYMLGECKKITGNPDTDNVTISKTADKVRDIIKGSPDRTGPRSAGPAVETAGPAVETVSSRPFVSIGQIPAFNQRSAGKTSATTGKATGKTSATTGKATGKASATTGSVATGFNFTQNTFFDPQEVQSIFTKKQKQQEQEQEHLAKSTLALTREKKTQLKAVANHGVIKRENPL
jgi:hypothetical protein